MKYLLFFLLALNLHAQIDRLDLIKEVLISSDNKNFKKTSRENDELLEYIQIKLNKDALQNDIYYLRLYCTIDELIDINTPYKIKNESIFIKLDKNSPQTIKLHFEKRSSLIYNDIFNEFEYDYIINEEKLLFGIAYGIIICAFLYNLVFYFYNRYKSFLYYSLLQISLLSMLVVTSMSVKLFAGLFKYVNVYDISLTFIMIFAILFNVEFLNTKKYLPWVHKFLYIVLYLHIIDFILIFIFTHSIMDVLISSSAFIAVLVLSAIVIYLKGYKPAMFYILGWAIIFFVAVCSEYNYLNISSIYLVHIGLPLESLLFSLALGYKIKQIELDKQKNEQLLIHQNKLATTGEMINNIAHQWRQPLTHISYIFMNINGAFKHQKLDEKYLAKKTAMANKQLEYMSNTIDDFKNFYSVKKEKTTFFAKDVITKAISITSATLEDSNIHIEVKGKDFEIQGFNSEFAQIILNIIANAKDALIKNKSKNPNIQIELLKDQIKITDNAGGIKKDIQEKIFEPYFSTKQKGSGIGLYMSKVIIETHFDGKLSHQNIKNGSCFTIKI